jgi:hypothetical protein
VLNNPISLVDPSGHRSCTAQEAARGDETCWQNIWSEFRSKKQQELDKAIGYDGRNKNKPRILFDRPQIAAGEIISISPRSDQEAFAFMEAGERAVKAFAKSIVAGNSINSCNKFVAAYLGLTDVDGDGMITEIDYASPINGLKDQNGSVFSNKYSPGANIAVYGDDADGDGLSAPLHSGIIIFPDENDPLKSSLIQTNTTPTTYGIYYTTIGGNKKLYPFPVWYLIK